MKIFSKLRKIIFLSNLYFNKITNKPLKVVIGAGNTVFKGWLLTDIDFLDITDEENWSRYFKEGEISNILAEHVWEHLTREESKVSLENCFKFLKKDGNLRIAVPDGNFPNEQYINYVRPGGDGAGADDHKILYTYRSLGDELERAGFAVRLIEYFNESGQFVRQELDIEKGFVHRSYEYDKRNKDGINYTSIIIDGIKK